MITIWSMTKAIWNGRQTSRRIGLTQIRSNCSLVRSRKRSRESISMLKSCAKVSPYQSQTSDRTRTLRARFSHSSWHVRPRPRMFSHLQVTHRCGSQAPKIEQDSKQRSCNSRPHSRTMGQVSSLLRMSETTIYSQSMVSMKFKRKSLMEARRRMSVKFLSTRWWQLE